MYVPLRKAVEATGLHPWTLRKYADNGSIPSIRTPNGQRLFDIDAFLRRTDAMVCYARVSTPKQRADLDRQAAYLSERYPGAEVINSILKFLSLDSEPFC